MSAASASTTKLPSTPAVRAVVFDFGGVVGRRPTTSRTALVAQHLGVPLPVVQEALGPAERDVKCGKLEEAAFWRAFATKHGGHVPNEEAWANALSAHYLASGLHLDVLALARALAKQGILTPLCANTVPSRVALNLKRGAYAPFWPRILSCEVGATKPDVAIFADVCAKTGLPPAAHLLVDDKPRNVEAARAFGMQAYVFVSLTQLVAHLRQLALPI